MSLPVLGVALVVLVVALLFGLSVADGQLATAQTDSVERGTAAGIADRLVASASPVTPRANVIRPEALSNLSAVDLRRGFGLQAEDAVRVSLDGTEMITGGDARGGTTIERLVLVETRVQETVEPRFADTRSVTLPRRTRNVSVTLSPSTGSTIETVTVNGGVVLHDPSGLSGEYSIEVPRYQTPTLGFAGGGSLSHGDVELSYWPAETSKARLRVTVRRWGDSNG